MQKLLASTAASQARLGSLPKAMPTLAPEGPVRAPGQIRACARQCRSPQFTTNCSTGSDSEAVAGIPLPAKAGSSLPSTLMVERVAKSIDLGEGGLWPGGVAQCDGPMETGERRRRQVEEHVVEQDDLFPVGVCPIGGLGMASDDGGLQLIRAEPV